MNARKLTDPCPENGVVDLTQKLRLEQLRDEIQEWVEIKLSAIWKSLNSRASKGSMRLLIGIAIACLTVFSGGIVYVSQVDKAVMVNTTKIESIEETIKGQNQMLQDILDAVKK